MPATSLIAKRILTLCALLNITVSQGVEVFHIQTLGTCQNVKQSS